MLVITNVLATQTTMETCVSLQVATERIHQVSMYVMEEEHAQTSTHVLVVSMIIMEMIANYLTVIQYHLSTLQHVVGSVLV